MNPEDMKNLFLLAHLELPDSEREIILRQINEIIDHVNRLQSLSLPESSLYYYPNPQSLPLRTDEACAAGFKETMLQNAPVTEGPYIVTPPVIAAKVDRRSSSESPSEDNESVSG